MTKNNIYNKLREQSNGYNDICSNAREGSKMENIFQGSFVAVVTPFKGAAETAPIDYDALARLLPWHVKNSRGIVVGGCTGESFTLTNGEQRDLISFVVQQVGASTVVIAGTGSNRTAEALELTRHAAEVGAKGVMAITPYGNKPPEIGLIKYYTQIATAAQGLPVMLYNVPSRTGCNLLPRTVARLHSEVENIVAIKEASGNISQVREIMECSDITVLSGDDALTLPLMAIGARGVVSVTANIAPALVELLTHKMLGGHLEEARDIDQRLSPVHQAMFFETNPIPVKEAMCFMGLLPNAYCREPLSPMSPEQVIKLHKVLLARRIYPLTNQTIWAADGFCPPSEKPSPPMTLP